MNAMNSLENKERIARLDGYLSGLAAMSGSIKQYSAFAYTIELPEIGISNEQALMSHYSWLPEMSFSSAEDLGHKLGDLEIGLRPFLARTAGQTSTTELEDLQKYLSFRVMDIISPILLETDCNVFKLISMPEPSASTCVFFCIREEHMLLVLQFNDDLEFINNP